MESDRPTAEQVAQLTLEQRARITDDELGLLTRAQLQHLLQLSPDQITQTLHPGALLPPGPPQLQQQQQQQQQPPPPPQPAVPLVPPQNPPIVRPTPAELAREAKNKRKRDGADEDADRASEIRALVRLADNRHLLTSIVPFDERPEAEKHTDYHVRHWKGDTDPCVVNTLPNFAVQATAITLEDALTFNRNKNAWLEVLRRCAANRDADDGFACLVQVMDKVVRFDDIPTVRERIEEGFSRMCHSTGITALSPQPTADARDGHPNFSPRTFMLRLPLECGLSAAAGYAYHIKWPECQDGIIVTVLLPDHAPPTHVGSYEDMRALPTITPFIQSAVRAKVQAHVANRFPGTIADFLRANNARLWEGGQLEDWWCELLQESINVKFWESTGSDGKKTVTLSVYCLGVFDASWLHSVWEEALLGDVLDLGEYGAYKRTATNKKRKCSICHDRDHHARVCPVWYHPMWPETLRQRRDARIQAENAREHERSAEASGGEFSRGRGRGHSPRGRGGYNNSYGPPPPFMFGYSPGPMQYPAYGFEGPPRGTGHGRGRGRGRGRGW